MAALREQHQQPQQEAHFRFRFVANRPCLELRDFFHQVTLHTGLPSPIFSHVTQPYRRRVQSLPDQERIEQPRRAQTPTPKIKSQLSLDGVGMQGRGPPPTPPLRRGGSSGNMSAKSDSGSSSSTSDSARVRSFKSFFRKRWKRRVWDQSSYYFKGWMPQWKRCWMAESHRVVKCNLVDFQTEDFCVKSWCMTVSFMGCRRVMWLRETRTNRVCSRVRLVVVVIILCSFLANSTSAATVMQEGYLIGVCYKFSCAVMNSLQSSTSFEFWYNSSWSKHDRVIRLMGLDPATKFRGRYQ